MKALRVIDSTPDDGDLWDSIKESADARKKNFHISRLMTMLTAAVFSGTVIGGIALWVAITTPKQEIALNVSPELLEEKTLQKEWLETIQSTDHTVDVDPMAAQPGTRQVLAANLGKNVILPNLRRQLANPDHACGKGAETVESCAFRAEKDNIDREIFEVKQGIQFAVFRKNPTTGKFEYTRPLDELQLIDNQQFRQMGMEAAIARVTYTPNPDSHILASMTARDRLFAQRVKRVATEGNIHAAEEIKKINSILPRQK